MVNGGCDILGVLLSHPKRLLRSYRCFGAPGVGPNPGYPGQHPKDLVKKNSDNRTASIPEKVLEVSFDTTICLSFLFVFHCPWSNLGGGGGCLLSSSAGTSNHPTGLGRPVFESDAEVEAAYRGKGKRRF